MTLGPVENVQAVPEGGDTISVTWDQFFNNDSPPVAADGYEVEIDSGTPIDVGDVQSYTDGGLSLGTTRQYRVRAYYTGSPVEYSQWSATAEATTASIPRRFVILADIRLSTEAPELDSPPPFFNPPPENLLAAALQSPGTVVSVYDTDSWAIETNLELGADGPANGVSFSNDRTLLAVSYSSSEGSRTRIYRTSDWGVEEIISNGSVGNAFSHDDSMLAVAGGFSAVLDTSDWSEISSILAGNNVAFNHDGSLLAAASSTGVFLRVYDTSDWSLVTISGGQPDGSARDVAFNQDGSLLAVAHSFGQRITVYDTSDWSKVSLTGGGLPDTGFACSFSHDGAFLAAAHTSSPYATVYDTSDWSKVSLSGGNPPAQGRAIAFDRSGFYLAVGSSSGARLTVYETPSFVKVGSVESPSHGLVSLASSG